MERTRRLRMNERVRDMVRENHVRVDELIYPIFVIEGENICEPVESMPGIYQYSIDRLHEELDRVREAGIPAVLLFGIPADKDEQGSGAYAEDGIVPQAIRYIKKSYKELVVIADVCLCEYTSHGHCGLICDGEVLNDETLPLLAKTSVVYAKAGADIILFETVPSLKEAKVEAEIAEEYGYDYWISFSCLSENIICEGTPIAECATTFAKGYPHLKMIGVNCTKPEYITGLIHKIKENCDIPIGVYPNSGEEYDAVKKVWFGKQSALSFEQYAYNYMKSGASAVGGCCTTVAKHVEEVVRAKKRFSEEQK